MRLFPMDFEEFLKNKLLGQVRTIQNEILSNYAGDFSKHAPAQEVPRIDMDFLVQREGALLPIEVKGGTSIKATSLHNSLKEHPDISAIRYSMLPYRQQENITNMPLYGVFLRT